MAYQLTTAEHSTCFVDLLTKALQGALFVNLCEGIMGCKRIDNLKIGPTPTKERVENMDKVESRKELIKSNVDTKYEKVVRKD